MRRSIWVTLGIWICLPAAIYGTPVTGTVIGTWQNVLLSGNVIQLNAPPLFLDNTTTAVYRVNNSSTPGIGSSLIWGNSTTGATQPFSELNFFGATLTAVPANTPVKLGTLTFLNGTSDLNSLIFGAQLVFSIQNNPTVTPLVANTTILTTANTGFDQFFDADVFEFDVLLPKSFNVFEGDNATIDIYGKFINDPQIELTDIVLEPGQTGGFIGTGVPAAVPEPASALLMAGGIGALALAGRWRR